MRTIGAEQPNLADLLAPWHDFYVVTGTAGATLVGLLFVAATLGSGVFTEERRPHFRAFVSPSVAHFSSALALSLAALAPLHRWLLLAVIEGGVALFGLAYSTIVWGAMIRLGITTTLDLEDRIWYGALPALTYALVVATAIALWAERAAGLPVLPCGVGLLLLVGIRNAWDITSWTITRRRG
ncbi:MAG: hypothetical protein ACREFJ_14150 [Acetobacteraceae bacterium]